MKKHDRGLYSKKEAIKKFLWMWRKRPVRSFTTPSRTRQLSESANRPKQHFFFPQNSRRCHLSAKHHHRQCEPVHKLPEQGRVGNASSAFIEQQKRPSLQMSSCLLLEVTQSDAPVNCSHKRQCPQCELQTHPK